MPQLKQVIKILAWILSISVRDIMPKPVAPHRPAPSGLTDNFKQIQVDSVVTYRTPQRTAGPPGPTERPLPPSPGPVSPPQTNQTSDLEALRRQKLERIRATDYSNSQPLAPQDVIGIRTTRSARSQVRRAPPPATPSFLQAGPPQSPPHSMREPIIFEPRPMIRSSGGSYEMILVYQIQNMQAQGRRMRDYLMMNRAHWHEVLSQWEQIRDSADPQGHPDFPPPADLRKESLKDILNREDVFVEQTLTTPRGRQILGLARAHVRIEDDAEALLDRVNDILTSLRKHTTNSNHASKINPSTNPYQRSRSKRSIRDRTRAESVNLIRTDLPEALKLLANLSPHAFRELDVFLTEQIEFMCKHKNMSCQIEWPHKTNSTRFKRFWGLLNSIGVIINGHRLNQIGHKVEVLLQNDQLLDRQVHHIANYLNMTMITVATLSRNQMTVQRAVKNLGDVVRLLMRKETANAAFHNYYHMLSQEDMTLRDILKRLETDIVHAEQALLTAQTHKLSPELVSPRQLHKYLASVEEDLKNKPRLRLPGDFRQDIWSFYAIIRVEPILRPGSGTIMLVCTIPLLDTSIDLNIYRVHSLPAIHGPSGLMAEYRLEGEYFAVSQDQTWVAVPRQDNMLLCEATGQHVCHLNAPLIPRQKCRLCLCAMFDDIMTDQSERIKESCFVNVKDSNKASKAVNFGGNIWAVVVPQNTTLFKHCRDRPERITITPPVTFVNLTGGCYAFTENLYLTPQAHFTSTADIINRWDFMKTFEPEMSTFNDLRLWKYIQPNTTSLDELRNWKYEELPLLPAELPVGELDRHIKTFSMKSFWNWGKAQKWISIITITIVIVMALAGIVYILVRKGYLSAALNRVKNRRRQHQQLPTSDSSSQDNISPGTLVNQGTAPSADLPDAAAHMSPPPYDGPGLDNKSFETNEKRKIEPDAPPATAELVPYNPATARAQARAARVLSLVVQEELDKPSRNPIASVRPLTAFPDPSPEHLASQIEQVTALPDHQQVLYAKHLRQFIK